MALGRESVPNDKLLDRLKELIAPGRILALPKGWQKQDIMTEVARWMPAFGSPSGAVISLLIRNLIKDFTKREAALRSVRTWIEKTV
jgi:hypothetical protein